MARRVARACSARHRLPRRPLRARASGSGAGGTGRCAARRGRLRRPGRANPLRGRAGELESRGAIGPALPGGHPAAHRGRRPGSPQGPGHLPGRDRGARVLGSRIRRGGAGPGRQVAVSRLVDGAQRGRHGLARRPGLRRTLRSRWRPPVLRRHRGRVRTRQRHRAPPGHGRRPALSVCQWRHAHPLLRRRTATARGATGRDPSRGGHPSHRGHPLDRARIRRTGARRLPAEPPVRLHARSAGTPRGAGGRRVPVRARRLQALDLRSLHDRGRLQPLGFRGLASALHALRGPGQCRHRQVSVGDGCLVPDGVGDHARRCRASRGRGRRAGRGATRTGSGPGTHRTALRDAGGGDGLRGAPALRGGRC